MANAKNPGPGAYHEDIYKDPQNRTLKYGGFDPIDSRCTSKLGRREKGSIYEDPSKGFPGPGAYQTDNELTAHTSKSNMMYNSFCSVSMSRAT